MTKVTSEIKHVLRDRIAAVDWTRAHQDLDARGHARIPELLAPALCDELAALYVDDVRFRSTISMERFRFGRGEYRYFTRPLPPAVETLRAALYRPLARIANGLRNQFWGDRTYEALDLEGHRWRFHQVLREVPRSEWRWNPTEPSRE